MRDLGHDVTIYERSAVQLEQRGAGIGFLKETARYLVERAHVDLDTISVTTEHIRHLDRSGCVIHDEQHSYRFSSWNAIYRSLLSAFGTNRYLLNHEVSALSERDHVVTAQLRNGNREDFDLVVCADGVGSRFRSELLPGVEPRYSGYVAWRGMVPEREVAPHIVKQLGDAITYVVSANSHILVYPIPGLDGSVASGERLINYVWYRNYLAGPDLEDLLTGIDGVTRDVSVPPGLVRAVHVDEMKAGSRARYPEVIAAIVNATKEPFLQVVLDVEVERMAFGRVCLLGDAAWVARPHSAAGTAKAADDAWALADALSVLPDESIRTHIDVAGALQQWEQRQLGVGRQLLDRTRRIGAQSQFDGTWKPEDPEHIFGLMGPGR
jgi:2,6-dihydroxypyridine 3-monooxygenase